jgi:acyl-coenzyme A thioesterase PaaI-like protein
MLADQLQQFYERVAAPWVRALGLRVTAAERGEVTFELDVRPDQVHTGGVLCGQALMAAFDTGMVLVMASLDAERMFTTVQMNAVFERGIPEDTGTVTFRAHATKPGRSLVFGQVDCYLPDTKRAATATTTYMWL